jgi:hypothetical protein|tara:strand:- start:2161 stop:2916 length:756 start_codon:yes stop_codon:yes gene_type:complete
MAFPTTVQLKQGMEKVETSSQKHKLGTRGVTSDGRIFYYAENSGTAITHGGYLVDGIAAVAAHDMDLAATATSAGATSFTSGTSLTVTKDQYKDGYVYFNDGPGQGETYKVKSNTAVSSATGLSITIDDEDGLVTALTTSSLFGLMYNPYKDIKIIDGDGTMTTGVLGVTTAPVTADYFCWIQTSGPASVRLGAQVGVVGDALTVSQASGESGEAERTDYSDEADIANIGTAMGIPAVDSDNQWCMLNIRA